MAHDESAVRSPPLHRAGVQALMRAMQADGFRIERADASGFLKPQKIGSKEPDVIGLRTADGLYAFGEAKTGDDDIDTEHTRTQLTEFSGRKMSGSGVQCPLYVAVPQRCADQLAALLRELGLVHMPHIRVVLFEWDDPLRSKK